ncbi:MAG: response regulator [Nitrospirae bacterium]|nr:MAG: response regulator [Nitrospirota bacterium]
MRLSHRPSWLPIMIFGIVVMGVAIGIATLYYVETRMIAAMGESLALAAADIADKLDRTLSERHSDIRILAQAPVFRGGDAAAKTSVLQNRKTIHPYYLWLGVTDAQGRIVAATNPASVGGDRSQRDWFKDVRDRGIIHVRDAQASEDSGGIMAVAFTAPILGPQGEFLGVVTSRVALLFLEDVFRQTVQTLQFQRGFGSTIEYQFLNRDGDIIADSIFRQEGMINLKQLGLPSALLTASAKPGYIEETHLRRHVQVITGYAQTEQSGDYLGLHWGVLVRMDRMDAVAPIRKVLFKLAMAGALVFIPMLGFLLWTTGRLEREWVRVTKAEAEAHEVQEWLVTILKSIGDAVIVLDKNGSVTFMNAIAELLTGWKEKEAKGQPLTGVFRIVNEKTRQPSENPADKVMREGVIVGLANHTVLIAKDGTEWPIDDSGAPIRNAQGDLIGVVLVFRDITERKRSEAELQKSKEAAEAANMAKSEFLASMSHEIRTPMNAIVGMADLLWETPLSQEQKEYVQIFRRAGGTLLTLINDILDLSKVEAGHMELEEVDFDLHDTIEKAVEVVAIRAHEKGLELTSHVMSDVPTDLVGDPTRLRQVLLNLLGNAIKFTESGEVILRVTKDPASPDPGALRFSISDSGIGIPSDKLGTIFERFTQVDSSTTRRYGGTGLGLTISKRLVELMGGRIEVESRVGHGTTFFFTLRAGVWTGPKRRMARLPVDMNNLNTLVVDDNATNRLILREMLTGWKARVTEAAGGEEALARLRRAQEAGDPYRLVLLDCRMPDMDGFQVVDATKRYQGLANVTIMMLTSDGRGGDLARAKELGLAAYMVKPVKRGDLLNAISAALSMPLPSRQEAPPETVHALPGVQQSLRILLVEDAEDNRLLIQAYLKHTAHRLDIAENGEIACGKFKVGRYDLVLMDVQMPVMDGYTATQEIREWEQANHRPPTPIIALTAHALKEDEEKSLAAGCTAHLTKPIKKATLLAAILEHTRSPVA